MIVSFIVAMDRRRGIGFQGGLPWRLSTDLKRFKELTMGHHLIAGRKTYESIGKPLPGREMIVVTRHPDYQAPGSTVTHSLDEALAVAERAGEEEVFVIGGGEVFSEMLPRADRLYLTEVEAEVPADTYFPEWSREEWLIDDSREFPAAEKDQFPHRFNILSRI